MHGQSAALADGDDTDVIPGEQRIPLDKTPGMPKGKTIKRRKNILRKIRAKNVCLLSLVGGRPRNEANSPDLREETSFYPQVRRFDRRNRSKRPNSCIVIKIR